MLIRHACHFCGRQFDLPQAVPEALAACPRCELAASLAQTDPDVQYVASAPDRSKTPRTQKLTSRVVARQAPTGATFELQPPSWYASESFPVRTKRRQRSSAKLCATAGLLILASVLAFAISQADAGRDSTGISEASSLGGATPRNVTQTDRRDAIESHRPAADAPLAKGPGVASQTEAPRPYVNPYKARVDANIKSITDTFALIRNTPWQQPANWDRLKVGMTRSQVADILGKPVRVFDLKASEHMQLSYGLYSVTLSSRTGKVIRWLGPQEY